eukprot:TRINITY_DN8497_c0_g1_i1.p1 TRINITY_DN8497_c0_g1~~TRINITY_DN8497_c0_g1_i1.p1  ORF type:complete len:254 (+),score=76.46 TRINITY_DN8497_c0_g1_i1:99-860(+)
MDTDQTWGDIEEDESDMTGIKEYVTSDENGVKHKTVVEYATIDGKKVKITKNFKVYKRKVRVNKKVQERIAARKHWRKFGPQPVSTDAGMLTVKADLVEIETVRRRKQLREQEATKHLSDVLQPGTWAAAAQSLSAPSWEAITSQNKKEGEESKDSGLWQLSQRKTDETPALRVTNLSAYTTEEDLRELFRPFGQIARVYLGRDRVTNLARGFAFINFNYVEDAARAMEKLNGYGYDHLILGVEWAKPSNKEG